MAKVGRPLKYTKELVDTLIKVLQMGIPIKDAYNFVGIDKVTYYRWINKYPEFCNRVSLAKSEAKVGIISSLIKAIKVGKVEAIKYYLNNRFPDEWKDKQYIDQNINSVDVYKIIREYKIKIDNKTNEEKREYIQRVRKLADR